MEEIYNALIMEKALPSHKKQTGHFCLLTLVFFEETHFISMISYQHFQMIT